MAERQRSLPWLQFRPPRGLAYLGYIHNLNCNHKTASALSRDLCFSRHVFKLLPRLRVIGFQLTLPCALPTHLTHIPLRSAQAASSYISLARITTPLTPCPSEIPPHIPVQAHSCVVVDPGNPAHSALSPHQSPSSTQTVPLELYLSFNAVLTAVNESNESDIPGAAAHSSHGYRY